jgi:hypothetical protein
MNFDTGDASALGERVCPHPQWERCISKRTLTTDEHGWTRIKNDSENVSKVHRPVIHESSQMMHHQVPNPCLSVFIRGFDSIVARLPSIELLRIAL